MQVENASGEESVEALLWRKGDLVVRLGLSERTLDRMISARKFPRPDKRLGRLVFWRPETVRSWCDGPVVA